MRRARAVSLLPIAALVLASCAKDTVLPDDTSEAVCGDGIIAPTEECDGTFDGCNACRVVPGWQCNGNDCHPLCGDGIVGDGPSCANARKAEACDMTGYWIARETTFARDTVLNDIQTTSAWYVYHASQSGDQFQIEESIWCGVHVTGSATVDPTAATFRGLLYRNDMGKSGKHGPRRGTFKAQGSGCAFAIDRFYNVRGLNDAQLPTDFLEKPDLSTLSPMPEEPDPLNPTGQNLGGTDDPDQDGLPGAGYRITGIASGIRSAAQRDLAEYATKPGGEVAANAVLFSAPGFFDLQETILRVSDCGLSCGLVAARAFVAKDRTPRTTLRFLGRTLDGPTAKAIIKGPLRADPSTDLATCAIVRTALPHDPSKQ